MGAGRDVSSYRVTYVDPAQPLAALPQPVDDGVTPACYGPWRPTVVVGAPARGGLLLPDAHPSPSTVYAPRGVATDGTRLVVSDTGNHRVMIWHRTPRTDGEPADVVLGQPDFVTEGPAAGGRGPAAGMHLPTGVMLHEGRLVVADAWHHRLLVWDSVPTESDVPPAHVLLQDTPGDVLPNRGAGATASSAYWPFGIAMIDGRFYVADTGNRRVLAWRDGLPLDGRPADVVLGQVDAFHRDENRGGDVAADSFRWPHAVVPGRGGVLVCDAGNHRLLWWSEHPDADRPADAVLGQPDFTTGTEFPYVSQENRLRFPYGAVGDEGALAVADTANNRVLVWDETPVGWRPPDHVLAQPDAVRAGENRWSQVAHDTLCWPYGLARHGDTLAVADSGNNRVVLWTREG